VAAYVRSVMNNIVSNIVIVSKLAGLTLIGVCMLHCLAVD